MPPVCVNSEIGTLKSVLVHTPGNELLAVTPGTRADYLYDDIIELETARREHQRMVAVLQRFAQVYEVQDLLREVVKIKEARDLLIAKTLDVVPSDSLARQLSALDPAAVVSLLIEGAEEEAGPIGKALKPLI